MPRFVINKEEVLRLHNMGKTVAEIMGIMNLKETTVRSAYYRIRITPNPSISKRGRKMEGVKKDKVKVITSLYMNGLTPLEIVAVTGYPRSSITITINRHLTVHQRSLALTRRMTVTGIIMRLHDTGMCQADIARRMNISEQNVALIVEKMLAKRSK